MLGDWHRSRHLCLLHLPSSHPSPSPNFPPLQNSHISQSGYTATFSSAKSRRNPEKHRRAETAYLGHVDGPHADPLGGVDSERDGEGLQAHGPVSLDGFKIVDDGDAKPGQAGVVGGWREGAREGGREGSRLAIDHSPETTILVSNFLLLSALICLLALPYRKGTMAWTRFSLSPALPPALPPAFPLALAYLYKIV